MFSTPLPEFAWNKDAQKRVLRALRNLMTAGARSGSELAMLKAQLVKDLQSSSRPPLSSSSRPTSAFAPVDEVADVLLKLVQNVGYGKYTVSEIRRKSKGLRGNFNGELFEILVANQQALQRDLRSMAKLSYRM